MQSASNLRSGFDIKWSFMSGHAMSSSAEHHTSLKGQPIPGLSDGESPATGPVSRY